MNEQILLLSSKLFLLFWIGYYGVLTVQQYSEVRLDDKEFILEYIRLPLRSFLFLVILYFFCFNFVAELPRINLQSWILSSPMLFFAANSHWLAFVGSITSVGGTFLIAVESCAAKLVGRLLVLAGTGLFFLLGISLMTSIVQLWQAKSNDPVEIFVDIIQCFLAINASWTSLYVLRKHYY